MENQNTAIEFSFTFVIKGEKHSRAGLEKTANAQSFLSRSVSSLSLLPTVCLIEHTACNSFLSYMFDCLVFELNNFTASVCGFSYFFRVLRSFA